METEFEVNKKYQFQIQKALYKIIIWL